MSWYSNVELAVLYTLYVCCSDAEVDAMAAEMGMEVEHQEKDSQPPEGTPLSNELGSKSSNDVGNEGGGAEAKGGSGGGGGGNKGKKSKKKKKGAVEYVQLVSFGLS